MTSLRKHLLALACASSLSGLASAGTVYFDFNSNFDGSATNSSLFLFGGAGQQATVSNLAGFSQTVTLNAQGFFNLAISDIYQQSGTGIRNTGFEVNSAQNIAGYFINRKQATTDMTYLQDSNALGTNYVVASMGGGFGEGSQVAVHATQDNTQVTFTPKGGAPINVTLQKGETYKYAGGPTDLTGSSVTSNKAVAVFSGHACAQVPVGTSFCDTLLEQAIATDKLSKVYEVTASKGASLANGDLVRVIATADATQVKVNGAVVATLNKGQFHELSLAANTGATIETSEAAAVAQYLKGGNGASTDPAMSYVPGKDTWLKTYRLATPSGGAAFSVNYASIVIDTDDLDSLLLNGVDVDTSSFTAIGSTGFSRGNVDLGLGLFEMSAANPFLLMLGGGSGADSYFTYGGATFAPGISEPPPPAGVPIPGTAFLVAAAMAGLGLTRKRRPA